MKGQQRLEEAERRTRDTAGERAAERIKLQFADRPADHVSSSRANTSNAIAGGAVQDVAQDTVMSGDAEGRRTSPRVRNKMTRSERNDSARRRQNWRWKCQMCPRSGTSESSRAEEPWICDVTVGNRRTSTTVTQRRSAVELRPG